MNKRFFKSSINFFARIIGIVNAILILKFIGTGQDVDNFVLTYAVYNYLVNLVSPIVEAQSTASFNLGEYAPSLYQSINFITRYFVIVVIGAAVFISLKFNIYYAVICIALIFSNYSAIFFGYAAHKENWISIFWANFIRLIVSASIIIIFHSYIGIYSAILGIMLADLSKYLFLKIKFFQVFRGKAEINFDFNKQVSKQISSHILNGFSPVANRYIAEFMAIPQIIYLDLAEKIYAGTGLLFAYQYLPTKFNDWSAMFINNHVKTKKVILKISWIVGLLGIIFSCSTFFVFAKLNLLSSSALILPTLFYFLGLGPYLSTLVLVKLIILLKKTQVLSYIAVLQILINLILAFALAPLWGLSGIAIAVTAASTITTIALWIYTLTLKEQKIWIYEN